MIVVVVCFAAGFAGTAAAQVTPPKQPPALPRTPRVDREPEPPFPTEGSATSEKALAVDPNVYIQLPCILQARVRVNGWQRDEIRVFIKNGTGINFKVHEKDPKSGKPSWVLVTKLGPPGRVTPYSECLSGERIDIEVPFGAAVKITGKETETRVDSIKKIILENAGGNVSLRNIPGGISSKTYEGDVTVENSGGQISLDTNSGNIIAYGVLPGNVGDIFKAKTNNGRITLQNVEHRQITADSISGEVVFSGKFLSGGLYNLRTTAGAIRLAIPFDSSCRISALYGGTLNSAIPFKAVTKNASPAGNTLNAVMGEGDATVNLSTHNGQILISKL